MTPQRLTNVQEAFQRRFAGAPSFVARGPGRVNLIGEHTDYNQGFVLPCALPFDVLAAARPRPDEMVVLHSMNFRGDASFPLDKIEASGPRWAQYVKGVAWALQEAGYPLRGVDMVLEGDVPVGSGLSSSAALEVAVGTAFAHATETAIPGPEMAQICKKAENDFAGVPSGIMDQFISAVGQQDHALFLDCRDLSYEQIPFAPEAAGLSLVVADTAKRRSLAESVYGQRVEECAEAVRLLRQFMPDIHSLRDVPFDRFQVYQPKLPDIVRRRARHVITENARVLGAVDALRFGAIEGMGAMMNLSHDSLRDDYEVTGEHLDAMVEESRRIPGVIGSRMTGAGFGGCTVTLVRTDSLGQFMEEVPARYQERTGLTPALYAVKAAAGAGIV
jgi:galactokinase